jgi:hypothetical protein
MGKHDVQLIGPPGRPPKPPLTAVPPGAIKTAPAMQNRPSRSSPHNESSTLHNEMCPPHNAKGTSHNAQSPSHIAPDTPHNDAFTPHNGMNALHNETCAPHNEISTTRYAAC